MAAWVNEPLALGYVALLLTAAAVVAYMSIATVRRRREAGRRIVTVLRCLSCDGVVKRGFREGDYVGKIVDEECPACGGKMVIEAIYEEKAEPISNKILWG